MNKADAKRIAETITREQLAAMFDKAKASITDWKKPSPVNPAISLGAAWNIYYPCLVKSMGPIKLRLVRANMIWVFGDYLPDELKPPKKDQRKSAAINVFHEEPIFEVSQ
jgi:hypothetical protein